MVINKLKPASYHLSVNRKRLVHKTRLCFNSINQIGLEALGWNWNKSHHRSFLHLSFPQIKLQRWNSNRINDKLITHLPSQLNMCTTELCVLKAVWVTSESNESVGVSEPHYLDRSKLSEKCHQEEETENPWFFQKFLPDQKSQNSSRKNPTNNNIERRERRSRRRRRRRRSIKGGVNIKKRKKEYLSSLKRSWTNLSSFSSS